MGHKNIYNNGVILAVKKKSLFMKNLMENCPINSNNFLKLKFFEIMNTTGPTKFTNIVIETNKECNKIKILDWPYFEPCLKNLCDIKNNTIVVHKHQNTWINTKLINFFKCIFLLLMFHFSFCPILG